MVKVWPSECFLCVYRYQKDDPGEPELVRWGVVLHLYLIEGAGIDFPAQRIPGEPPTLALSGHEVEISADPDELARWIAAQQVAVAALRKAATRLLYGHGYLTNGRPAPGLRASVRRGSPLTRWLAFGEFRKRVRLIEEAYRPVRDELQRRVREAKRQERERRQQIREREAQRKRDEQRRRIRAVAARTMWSYRVDEAGGVVHVFHHEDGSGLDGQALKTKLLEICRATGLSKVRWDARSQDEVVLSSGVDFETWWSWVSPTSWEGSSTIPDGRVSRRGTNISGGDYGVPYSDSGGGYSGSGGGYSPPSF